MMAMRGEDGVTGERELFGERGCYSWNKCSMALTNMHSDWILIASTGLATTLHSFILFSK